MENANNLTVSLADFNSTFIKIFDLIFKEYPEGVVYKDWNFSYKIANSAFCECYKINFNNVVEGAFLHTSYTSYNSSCRNTREIFGISQVFCQISLCREP